MFQVSGGMVGASKLSELIYGKEVPSNDSSPNQSSSQLFHSKQRSPQKCCSTGHQVSRCHGNAQHRQNRLFEGG